MRRIRTPCHPAVVLLGALLTMACERGPTPRNLLFITVDTCRADHIGAYGYDAAQTPTIDRLAAEGTLFERAYATVPETLPSHSSMFTGLYPPSHAVRLNLMFKLPAEVLTMAEILRDEGLFTAAVTSAVVLDRRYGLDQGFFIYDDARTVNQQERRAREVTERALVVLDKAGPRPFFLWVHYYDPHSPFEPPPPFEGPDGAKPESVELYDLEIAYADHWIGELLDQLESRGALEDTLVVLTADHGESLGDHGETYHTLFVYDSTIHVPLVLAGPGIEAGKRVTDVVSSVDIFSSVLALLGVEAPDSSSRLLPGLPVSRRRRGAARVAYSESMTPPLRYGWSVLQAIRTSGRLYIRAPQEEVYRLDGSDSGHEINLADSEPRDLAALRSRLAETVSRMPQMGLDEAAGHQPSDQERRALEALGYLGGESSGDGMPAVGGTDPKDMIEVAEAIQLGRLAGRLGRQSVAEDLLSWAAQANPENFGVWVLLGRAYHQGEKYRQAIEALETALAMRPGSWEVLTELGAAEDQLGRGEVAEEYFRQALETSPFPAEVWRKVGRLRLRAQDYEAAEEAYRRVLEIDPEDPRAQEVLQRLEQREAS